MFGILSAVGALLGLGLLLLGLIVVMGADMMFGILVAAMGGILGTIGLFGVIVSAVIMARGEPEDPGYADEEDLAMVGSFVEDDEDDTGLL